MGELTIRLVQGDTYPLLNFLVTQNGVAVVLTGCTVKFKFRALGTTMQINAGHDDCIIENAATGAVAYEINAADLAAAGDYEGNVAVTFVDGHVQTTYDKIYLTVRGAI